MQPRDDVPPSAYADYLRLPHLLALQQPRSTPALPSQWADEHLFIVVHQAAELMLSHALIELDRAITPGKPDADGCPATALRRVQLLLSSVEGQLDLLDAALTSEAFNAFRPLLGEASGGQSVQFAALLQQVEAPYCGLPPSRCDAPGVAAAVNAAQDAARSWKKRHLALVERMIGDEVGTDGTDGVAYLRSRIDSHPGGPDTP